MCEQWAIHNTHPLFLSHIQCEPTKIFSLHLRHGSMVHSILVTQISYQFSIMQLGWVCCDFASHFDLIWFWSIPETSVWIVYLDLKMQLKITIGPTLCYWSRSYKQFPSYIWHTIQCFLSFNWKKLIKSLNPLEPWMSRGILISRKCKNELCNLSLKNPSAISVAQLILFRNIYNLVIRNAKNCTFKGSSMKAQKIFT